MSLVMTRQIIQFESNLQKVLAWQK